MSNWVLVYLYACVVCRSSQVVEVLCVGVVVAEHVEVHLHGNLHRQRAGGLEVREDVELKACAGRGQGRGRAKFPA